MNRLIIATLLLAAGEITGRAAQQLARVFVPPAVVFQVSNVEIETTASAPVTVSFDSAVLGSGQVLRVSVRADGDLTMPGGAAIPATNISWTTSNVAGGIGMNGALSKTVYTPVYESTVGVTSGRVDLTWKLAPPGTDIWAGTRQAALRWRFEAITP